MITAKLPSKYHKKPEEIPEEIIRAFFAAAQNYCNCQINFCEE